MESAGKWPRAVLGVENIPGPEELAKFSRSAEQTVAQTLKDVIARRPVLAPVLLAFEPLLSAQADFARALAAGSALANNAAALRGSAEKLLPCLENIAAFQPHLSGLTEFFLAPLPGENPKKSSDNTPAYQSAEQDVVRDNRELLAEAMLAEDDEALTRIAEEAGLEPGVLDFVGGFVLSTVLRAMTIRETARQPEERAGRTGRCPVCGSLPDIAYLSKPAVDDKNTFLAGGGGKKHLHCGRCGTNWKFQRSACPACGEQGSGVIEILRENGALRGERLDFCTKCNSYCPTLDLRECEVTPNFDAAALGMLHLDMVAAQKKLHPLKQSFWNSNLGGHV